jgi:peptidoglycan/xylan/chitin deacetylase (PgdA/CDA1 family)
LRKLSGRKEMPGKSRLPTVVSFLIFIFLISPSLIWGNQPAVVALSYHAFLEKKDPYSCSLSSLEDHLDRLSRAGFTFVSMEDIRGGRISGSKNILITVDDGNRSVYKAYHEVFKPRHIKPLLAIYPGIIGKKKYVLTWKELRELTREGCTVAAHGYFHLKIAHRLYKRDKWSFAREVYTSRRVLEKKLGVSVDVFVYPFGLYDGTTLTHITKAGYKYGFTINSGRIYLPLDSYGKPLELPRYMVTKGRFHSILTHISRAKTRNYVHRKKTMEKRQVKTPKPVVYEKIPVKSPQVVPIAPLTPDRAALRVKKSAILHVKEPSLRQTYYLLSSGSNSTIDLPVMDNGIMSHEILANKREGIFYKAAAPPLIMGKEFSLPFPGKLKPFREHYTKVSEGSVGIYREILNIWEKRFTALVDFFSKLFKKITS